MTPRILACGDSALSVEFGDSMDPALTARVRALDAALMALALPGIIETVPTFRSLMVHVDPLIVDFPALEDRILSLVDQPPTDTAPPRRWILPAVFGGPFGEDLPDVAARCGLTESGLIEAYVSATYRVGMIGYLPGFCYLSGLPEALAVPRRGAPRLRIPASSLSIGGVQTAIGTVEAPSGWHLIGRTPARPYQPGRAPVILFEPGDEITYDPVPADAWPVLDAEAASGSPVARLWKP
ncbi:Sporulation inhibitor KipI [Marinibacterium anthonyi]|nr:Sporulation inhibitor KipI [Marinibacterium anthonyi]